MENWFLNMGMSWTMSKAIPYILMILIGFILMRIIFRFLKNKSRVLKIVVGLVVLAAPFAVYFAINPIYQGDFTNDGLAISQESEMNPDKFTIIAMPGCPFCRQAIGLVSKMQERNSKMEIDFLVTSENPESLKTYQEIADNLPVKINIALAKDAQNLSEIAHGSFPTFVINAKNEGWKLWSNNTFGVMAMDQVEGNF